MILDSYTKDDSGSIAKLTEPSTTDKNKSSIQITSADISNGYKDKFIEMVDAHLIKKLSRRAGLICNLKQHQMLFLKNQPKMVKKLEPPLAIY